MACYPMHHAGCRCLRLRHVHLSTAHLPWGDGARGKLVRCGHNRSGGGTGWVLRCSGLCHSIQVNDEIHYPHAATHVYSNVVLILPSPPPHCFRNTSGFLFVGIVMTCDWLMVADANNGWGLAGSVVYGSTVLEFQQQNHAAAVAQK